jgi:hypothetical protein
MDEEPVIERLTTFVTALGDEGQPENIAAFVANMVSVMRTFKDSAPVLGKCATCLENIIPFYPEVSAEVTFECLSVCYGVLSGETFLSGDQAFSTVEALQKLVSVWSGTVTQPHMLSAMIPLVAQSTGEKLNGVLAALGELIRVWNGPMNEESLAAISQRLMVFHPEVELPPYLASLDDNTDIIDEYEKSFVQLADPEGVFDEVARLVELHPNGEFAQYPISVDRILQASWIAIHGKRAVHTEETLWQRTTQAKRQIGEMGDADYVASCFGPAALEEGFKECII